MIKKVIKKLLAACGLEIKKNSLLIGNALGEFNISREDWEKTNVGYFLKTLNLTVPNANSIFIRAYHYAKNITTYTGGKFTRLESGQVQLEVNGVKFWINDAEELFILNEVFVEGCYNYMHLTESYALLDIGQNVAITTLFFASKENVKEVYAYELFPQTYALGQENIKLNPAAQAKIKSNNFGLATQNEEAMFEYSPHNKGRMGMRGLPPGQHNEGAIRQKVLLKDIAEEIEKIQGATTLKLVCKMDCEGAEYDLLDRLFETRKVLAVDVYMIEWHYIKPDHIARQFDSLGYHVLQTVFPALNSGMLYALKH